MLLGLYGFSSGESRLCIYGDSLDMFGDCQLGLAYRFTHKVIGFTHASAEFNCWYPEATWNHQVTEFSKNIKSAWFGSLYKRNMVPYGLVLIITNMLKICLSIAVIQSWFFSLQEVVVMFAVMHPTK